MVLILMAGMWERRFIKRMIFLVVLFKIIR